MRRVQDCSRLRSSARLAALFSFSHTVFGAVMGYFSTSFSLAWDKYDVYRTHMARLYFIYSLVLTVNGAWMFVSAIVWPMVYTRHGVFAHEQPRRSFQRFNLGFNAMMLFLIIVFGPCALVYAAKEYYDDLASGWLAGQAPIFAVLVVFGIALLALNQLWDVEAGEETDGMEEPVYVKA